MNRCLIGVYLTSVHLMGVHLMGVHLMGVCLIDVCLISVCLICGQKRLETKPGRVRESTANLAVLDLLEYVLQHSP
jgi:hypothetical protein